MKLPILIPILVSVAFTGSNAAGQGITSVNVPPGEVPALAEAARVAGTSLTRGRAGANLILGQIVVWEPQEGTNTDIAPEEAERVGRFVQAGGSLLLCLGPHPGKGPFRLAFMLPTTSWRTLSDPAAGPTTLQDLDPAFFPNSGARFSVPFHWIIRPFDAVERGEQRYDRFPVDHGILYVDLPFSGSKMPADHNFWTRPLLNRDWHIRARSNDSMQSPLLLTGRYGAGRVAVFASSFQGATGTSSTQSFWACVLRWLSEAPPPASPPSAVGAPQTLVDQASHTLRVTLWSHSNGPRSLEVVARLLTWDGSLVGDVDQAVTVAGGGKVTAAIPLPQPAPTGYQSLSYRDAFVIRLGVLSGDGRNLLSETRQIADLRPSIQLSVATDDINAIPYPFAAPPPGKENRLGVPLMSYAYRPGAALHAHITLTNGLCNLAPLAQVQEETAPDNPSVMALNDEAAFAEKGPIDGIAAWGEWKGAAGKDHVLDFRFPQPVTVAAVTLIGAPNNYRNYLRSNPSTVIIEADGREVVRSEDASQRFVSEHGALRLPFPPLTAKVIRVRLPWTPDGAGPRNDVRLGDVYIEGTLVALPAPVQGTLTLSLRNSLTGALTPVAARPISLAPLSQMTLDIPVTVPVGTPAAQFFRLEASLTGPGSNVQASGAAPFIALNPAQPIQPLSALRLDNAPSLGFIVTRGFRNVFDTGTGTNEFTGSWSTPDDLIWAYEHQMKQLGARAHTEAGRLYLSDSDMRHYSTPWRDFPDGEYFYDVAAPLLVQRMKKDRNWNSSTTAILGHSDRWDTGPQVSSLNGWQDFEGFNDDLLAHGGTGLKGRTREELVAEIHEQHESEWQRWCLTHYVGAIRTLREAFGREGKRLVITAQGVPLVPTAYEKELEETIRGMSDDSTWGMAEDSVPLTTGRQMGSLAFNPGWAMSTLNQWGYDSSTLGNAHWHSPVGTTEPSRRHQYDRAFRGVLRSDGRYTSMHAYGYNSNAGYSYTMTPNDWQEWERVQEKMSLLTPEAPLGAGVMLSSSRLDTPQGIAFSGTGEIGGQMSDIHALMRVLQRLQAAGISIPFSANAAVLDKWQGTAPLILVNLNHFSDAQVAALQKTSDRGVPIAAFMGDGPLSSAAAALFGVTSQGAATTGATAGQIDGRPIVSRGNRLLIPLAADNLTDEEAQSLAPIIQHSLALPLQFPPGIQGYGFVSNGRTFIVVEDWREEGRTVEIHLRAKPGVTHLHALNTNDSSILTTRRNGPDWVIQLPLRPGDGALIAVEEE